MMFQNFIGLPTYAKTHTVDIIRIGIIVSGTNHDEVVLFGSFFSIISVIITYFIGSIRLFAASVMRCSDGTT